MTKPYRMLEVGPGPFPLCYGSSSFGTHWTDFPGSDYTAIQPVQQHEVDNFPRKYLDLPNVTLITSRIQDADLSEEHFDEVFMKNVLSDPEVGQSDIEIVLAAIKLLRTGGLLTTFENYTPAHGLNVSDFIGLFDITLEVKTAIQYKSNCVIDGLRYDYPTDEWIEAVGPYSIDVRRASRDNKKIKMGRFIQAIKKPA